MNPIQNVKNPLQVPLPQRAPKSGRRAARRAAAREKVIVETNNVKPEIVQVKSGPSAKTLRNRRRRQRRRARGEIPMGNGNRSSQTNQFIDALIYPDLVGPIRPPTVGATARTVLCMDKTEVSIVGSVTNTVQGCLMANLYTPNAAIQYAVADTVTGLGAGSSVANGAQFPNSTQLALVKLTSGCLTIRYTGPVDTCSGSILVGHIDSTLALATTTTWSILRYKPGFVEIPMTQLLSQDTLRVSLIPNDLGAADFIVPTQGVTGIDLPIILTHGLPNPNTIEIVVTRNWTAIPMEQTASGTVYEVAEKSFTRDRDAWQDAISSIAQGAFNTISTGFDYYQKYQKLIGGKDSSLFNSLLTTANMMGNLHLGRLQKLQPEMSLHVHTSVPVGKEEEDIRELASSLTKLLTPQSSRKF